VEGSLAAQLDGAAAALRLPVPRRGGHLGVRPSRCASPTPGCQRGLDRGIPWRDSIVHVEIEGQRIAVRVDGIADVAPGSVVRLAWDNEDTQLLRPPTEHSLVRERVEVAA
jgi:hypothetical protein